MLKKLKGKIKYIILEFLGNILYGLILFFGFNWLVKYSIIYAYLWNIALIISGLILDFYVQKTFQSDKLVMHLKKSKKIEKDYLLIQKAIENTVSFKTIFYMFYIIVLVFSKIIEFYPALFSENLREFIFSNSYSLLLLIAFDTLIGLYSKDRKKMKGISEDLKNSFAKYESITD